MFKCYKTMKLLLKNVLAESFSSVIKQLNVSKSVANILKYTSDGEFGFGRKKNLPQLVWMVCIFITQNTNRKNLEQKQPPEVFCKKGVLKNFAKSTGKHLCQSLLFNNKATGLVPASLLKKKLWYRCFPVNFAKFLRGPFYRTPLDKCFCWKISYRKEPFIPAKCSSFN